MHSVELGCGNHFVSVCTCISIFSVRMLKFEKKATSNYIIYFLKPFNCKTYENSYSETFKRLPGINEYMKNNVQRYQSIFSCNELLQITYSVSSAILHVGQGVVSRQVIKLQPLP